jgi:hypothetical protein
MHMNAARVRSGFAIALLVPAILGASGKKQRIDSHWRDHEVVIDGDNGEWPGPLVPVDEHQRIDAAAVNDGQFLYVVLSTSDASLRAQIMGQGLIVWFDPDGGDKKTFGIKYPVGMAPGEMPGRGRGFRRGDSSADGAQRAQPAAAPEPPNRLEIIGPKKDDAHSFVADKAPGISVKVGRVEGSLVYELKVPLKHSDEFPYALDARAAIVGFGLETPKMERPAGDGRGGMGGFGGGGGGGGGGGIGGRGGMGRGGGMGGRGGGGGMRDRFEPPQPLKAWATLQLASH